MVSEETESEEVCELCERPFDGCLCCEMCGGQGIVEDGGCGGGCEFCHPFPTCPDCEGSGRYDR